MSKIEVDTIDTQSSTTLQVGSTNTSLIKIGTSGDTVEYPAGTTFTQSGTQNVTSGGAINVKSGGSIIIESGAAITNNGTATGFSADLTNLNATNLTSGTVPDARFPATLPIANGSALTNLNATNLGSGTVPDARFPATLPAISGANLTNLPASGITVADQWRLTAQKNTSSSQSIISANLEQIDTAGQGTLGSAMAESSGVFTFPSTGIYLVISNAAYKNVSNNNANYVEIVHSVTTNNSSFVTTAHGYGYFNSLASTIYTTATAMDMIDVTDTSNVKIRFEAVSQQDAALDSSTTENYTTFTFIRMGDT